MVSNLEEIFSKTILNTARELVRNFEVKEYSITGSEDKIHIKAVIQGYNVELYCKHSKNYCFFYRHICECLFEGSCKHVAALGYYFLNDNNPNTSNIIKIFNDTIISKISSSHIKSHILIPYFTLDGLEISVKFKIGLVDGKRLVVKNNFEMYEFFNNNNEYTYGKDCLVKHDINKFVNQEGIQKVLDIINSTRLSLKLANAVSGGWYKARLSINNRVLYISEQDFLEIIYLFDIVYFNIHSKDTKVVVSNQHKKIDLFVSDQKDSIKAEIKNTDTISIYNSFVINIENNIANIYKFKKDCYEIGKYLLINNALISYEDYYDFYSITLKEMNEDFDIKNNVEIDVDYSDIVVDINMKKTVVSITLNEDVKNTDAKKKLLIKNVLEKYRIGKGYKIKNQDELIEFIQNDLEYIYNYADQVITNKEFKDLKIVISPKITTKVTSKKSGLRLELLTTEFDSQHIDQLINSVINDKKIVQLDSGEIIKLDENTINDLKTLTSALNIKGKKFKGGKIEIENYRSIYLDKALTKSNFNYIKDNNTKKLLNEFTEYNSQMYEIVKLNNVELRPYQVDGIKWMMFLKKYQFGGILADDMGLGKTVQVIALLEESENKSIVIAPSSLLLNWESEITKFGINLNAIVYSGNKDTRSDMLDSDYNLLITSYDILKRDIQKFENMKFEYVVIDEAQAIKNHSTQNAKAVKVLNAKYRLALTGTPLENNILDMWSIFDFIMPGYLYTHNNFKSKFNQNDSNLISALKEMISPFLLRRIKKDVLKELPDKIEQNVLVDLCKKERLIYDSYVHELKNLEDTNKLVVLSLLTKMRQACCNAGIIVDSFKDVSSKVETLIELICDLKASEQKVLVFSQFTSNFESIKKEFDKKGISYFELTGKTKASKRHEMVEQFNGNDTDVFLISLKAGGTGLNITGASAVIHFDPWWNVSAENQATDRAYRMGQKNVVNVYKIITRNTIEERILDLQKEKKQLVDALVENNDSNITSMSKDDIVALFD